MFAIKFSKRVYYYKVLTGNSDDWKARCKVSLELMNSTGDFITGTGRPRSVNIGGIIFM